MKSARRRFWSHGFTVLELIMAVAIAMVVLGVAIPSFLSWLPTVRLSSAARQVATDLQVARMKAISQNTNFRLNFVTTTTYTLEKSGPVTDSGPFSLPEGITTSSGPTPWFQPRGTADGSATITLNNGGGSTNVQIAPVGRVKICPC